MNAPPLNESAPAGRGQTGQVFNAQRSNATKSGVSQDPFAEINSHTIPELAAMLGLACELKSHGNQRSPLRDERHPSFSVFDGGRGWKDHGSGEGGDGVEFVRVVLGCDHAGVRDWYVNRRAIGGADATQARQRPAKASEPRKRIEWPGELVEGTAATWGAFSERVAISYKCTHVMAGAGLLRFVRVDGVPCYCITDATRRAAEIRRVDGRKFGDRKAYPLVGVRKDWLPGLALLAKASASAGILITEGPSDLLSAYDLYTRYRSTVGARSWVPCALLGAGCKILAPAATSFVRGRRVRLVPDGDEAGDRMAENWRELLLKLGCTVDVVRLPRGKDLSEVKEEIEPEGLFR